MKCFMKSQNFFSEEIENKMKDVEATNLHQMHKLVKRLRLGKEKRVMARCLDHWVIWLKVRKIMKHYLKLCNSSVQYVKCDMQNAFDKWKKQDAIQKGMYESKDISVIKNINIKLSKVLDKLADREAATDLVLADLCS